MLFIHPCRYLSWKAFYHPKWQRLIASPRYHALISYIILRYGQLYKTHRYYTANSSIDFMWSMYNIYIYIYGLLIQYIHVGQVRFSSICKIYLCFIWIKINYTLWVESQKLSLCMPKLYQGIRHKSYIYNWTICAQPPMDVIITKPVTLFRWTKRKNKSFI